MEEPFGVFGVFGVPAVGDLSMRARLAAELSVGLVVHFGARGGGIKRIVASPEYRSRWKRQSVT
jgi:hypothetical protein